MTNSRKPIAKTGRIEWQIKKKERKKFDTRDSKRFKYDFFIIS